MLNVIEDPVERLETMVDAFRHARRLLVVSALINETVEEGRAEQYRDGVVTQRNTFQKYFEQQELQQFLEDTLDVSAVTIGELVKGLELLPEGKKHRRLAERRGGKAMKLESAASRQMIRFSLDTASTTAEIKNVLSGVERAARMLRG